jgi:hypothetical protein
VKTSIIKNKILAPALLVVTAAIALPAHPASALGGMGFHGIGARIGGMGSGRPESLGSRAGALSGAGAITMNGITVLPNGALIVPAVIARVRGAGVSPQLNQLNSPPSTEPCSSGIYCAP